MAVTARRKDINRCVYSWFRFGAARESFDLYHYQGAREIRAFGRVAVYTGCSRVA
jgi:hypothetical protein